LARKPSFDEEDELFLDDTDEMANRPRSKRVNYWVRIV